MQSISYFCNMRLKIIFLLIFFSSKVFSQNSLFNIEILTDNFPAETYWVLEDQYGNIVDQIHSGDLVCSNTYYNWDINVDPSLCYTFTIYDTYGDGICCNEGNGSYTIQFDNFLFSGGSFHYSESTSSICSNVSIGGCTDPNADNYNSSADTNVVFGGVVDPNIGSGSFYIGDNQYLVFDAFVEAKIVSAMIYANHPCDPTFELRDANGNILEDTTIQVYPGGQRIYFDFEVSPGSDYQLGVSGNNIGLFRNNDPSVIHYPYDIGGLVSIQNSSVGLQGYPGYYYFYYDIEVEAICVSNTVFGCIDSTACNYNINANTDDGSCLYNTSLNFVDTSCDSYTWLLNGQTYTSSGIYIDSSFNSFGCYEISTLDLTINSSDYDTVVVSSAINYFWNDSLYTSTGIYFSSTLNSYNCDSISVLDLTIIPLNDFSPDVDVVLSNTYCDSLSDLTITVSQDSAEVDMASSLFQSNLGSFDISSMSFGDTIGTAYLIAGGGSISLNTYIMVSQVVNSSQAIIIACDSLQGCLGSFTISNNSGGGVSIFANAVFDGNNYTSGNMSSITFENVFINPCGVLTFTTSINSEFGDTDVQSFSYNISSVSNIINFNASSKKYLVKIIDLLGRDTKINHNKILLYIYSDGSIKREVIIK